MLSFDLFNNDDRALINNILTAIDRSKDLLGNFLVSDNFTENVYLAFGSSDRAVSIRNTLNALLDDRASLQLAIVSTSQLNGGNGAFAAASNTIYLSTEFLNNNNSAAIERVLLEEIGHYLDAKTSNIDAIGDEGEIFSALVRRENLDSQKFDSLKSENDRTSVFIDGKATKLELNTTYGNITLDGSVNDWTNLDRLDFLPGSSTPNVKLYGKYAGDAYVFAIESTNGTAIGANTTFWLNTDNNRSTGYQIFGFAGGAEYNINFDANGLPYLYTGAAGETLVRSNVLDNAKNGNSSIVEFAVPIAQLANNPQKIEILTDINDLVFIPDDYTKNPYTVAADLPQRTDFSKKVAIVYSETSANQYFDKTAYSQLFMSLQDQARMAGIPLDLISENDLSDLSKIVNYDTLIFPSFRNVQSSQLNAITDNLEQAVYKYGIGLVTAGDFLTNDETGAALPGDSYIRMKNLIDVTRTTGGTAANLSIKANDPNRTVLQGYSDNETIGDYTNKSYNVYDSVRQAPIVVANQVADGQTYNAILATQTGGRNVHFTDESILGDNNLAWQAIQWAVLGDAPKVGLNMSRDASIFISRNDMDQSRFVDEVPLVNVPLLDILEEWKQAYNFVGSYYINVGNNPRQQEVTDWTVSGPLYRDYIALGNEIGTHSYTHPDDTNLLTPDQIEFEFNQSQLVIERELGRYVPGFQVTGAAVPGAPEKINISQEIIQYFDYMTGGYSSIGAGYPSAFGFLTPDSSKVYLAPNISFDFNLIGFKQLTAAQAEVEWEKEYNKLTNKANQATLLFPWHDYAPTLFEPGYTKEMFTNFIARAYNNNTEFTTLEDYSQRIQTFDNSQLFLSNNGDRIEARVNANNVGTFGLDINGNKPIQNVENWYAYDSDTVFLPKAGGTFALNLGTTTDDVTHITRLPMRAELLSVTGDGTNLEFSFFGQGSVLVDLKNPAGLRAITEGASSTSINGEILTLNFDNLAQHDARIRLGSDNPPILANPIADVNVVEDAAQTTIDLTNVFSDLDGDSIDKSITINSNTGLVNTNIVGNFLTLTYLPNQFGAANITVRGTSFGNFVEDSFNVSIAAIDDAPTVINPIADINVDRNAPNTNVNLTNVFSDVDNDGNAIVKTIKTNSNSQIVNATISGDNLTLDYVDNQSGTTQITVLATSNGLTVEDTFTIEVKQPFFDQRIEAENMSRTTYRQENVGGASNGQVASLIDGSDKETGTAAFSFNGTAGLYDVVVGYYDEEDGKAELAVRLGNNTIDSWKLDRKLGSNLPDSRTFQTRTVIRGANLQPGDSFTIAGKEDKSEYARVDYVEIIPVAGRQRIEAEAMSRNTYRLESNNNASNKQILTLAGGFKDETGTAAFDFNGATGLYDVVVGYYDESDGKGQMTVLLGSNTLNSWRLDLDLGSKEPNNQTFQTKTVSRAVKLQAGDRLSLIGVQEKDEHARFDYIDLIPVVGAVRVEAESGDRNVYRTETVAGASGGNVVSLNGGNNFETGTTSFAFNGSTGSYDVIIGYYDENDGKAQLQVRKGDGILDNWTLDRNLGSSLPNSQSFTTRTVASGINVNTGDIFSAIGLENGSEFARIDYIDFVPSNVFGS